MKVKFDKQKKEKQIRIGFAISLLQENGYFVYNRQMNGEQVCSFPQFSSECREFHKKNLTPKGE